MLEALFTAPDRTVCVESRIDRPDPPYRPLFFYHVPKTGGLSFFVALCAANTFVNKRGDRLGALGPDTRVERFDEPPPHRRDYQEAYALLVSHGAFGLHRRFRQSFLLTTIVRDPFGRVRSDYTYNSMRKGRPVSGPGFEAMLRDEANRNRGVKQLAGQDRFDQPASPGLYEKAVETLDRAFHSFGTHQDVSRLIGLYLSYYRLPNILMDRVNTTTPAYQLDATPWRAEIEARNDQDLLLYEYVRANRRIPELALASPACHPVTVIVNEVDNSDRSASHGIGVDTARLARLVAENCGRANRLAITLDWLAAGAVMGEEN
jgi:hypothetical protein